MNDKLDAKNYQKLEKQFMAFGSACNALQGKVLLEEVHLLWEWSKKAVSNYVDELYVQNGNNDEHPL